MKSQLSCRTALYHLLILISHLLGGPAVAGTFTTGTTADTVSPQIVGSIAASKITGSSAVISWTTNELADSRVYFGTATTLNLLAGGIDYSLQHAVMLTKLNRNTTYRYQVTTVDPKGNSTSSSVLTFMTNGLTDQTITFTGSAPTPTYAVGGSFAISATATSGLPVTYSSQTGNVCAVSGSTTPATVQILSAGTCAIGATQAGNGDYAAAAPVTESVTIAKANQIALVATATPDSIHVGETSQLSATGGSTTGLVSYQTVSGTCEISGAVLTATGQGLCLVTATRAGNVNFNAVVSNQMAVSVLSGQPPIPSPGGPVEATITGGNFVQGFAAFTTPSNPLATQNFPYGVFTFSATTSVGGSITVTLTFPEPLPAGTKIMKQLGGNWIDWTSRTIVLGRVMSFSLTDGGYGDSDPTPGVIADPIGPVFGVAPPGPQPSPIPTLGEWARVMMILALLILFYRRGNKRIQSYLG